MWWSSPTLNSTPTMSGRQSDRRDWLTHTVRNCSINGMRLQLVLTLANIPITIFTSVINMPVLCINGTLTTVQPIFLAYTQSGPGNHNCVASQTSHQKTSNKLYVWEEAHEYSSTRGKKECTTLCTRKGCSKQHQCTYTRSCLLSIHKAVLGVAHVASPHWHSTIRTSLMIWQMD